MTIKKDKDGNEYLGYDTRAEYVDEDTEYITENSQTQFKAIAERLETTNEILFRMLQKLENVL